MVEQPSPRASILLVDDHPPNLMALEAVLEPLGLRLLKANAGTEAVAMAAREDLALVLLDLQMPQLDGFETAALLKKTERGVNVPIIILTAHEPTRAELARGYATGAVDFLFKPVDPDVLRSKVAVFVNLWQKGQTIPPGRPSRPAEDESGRLSERILAAAPTSAQAAMVEELAAVAANHAAAASENARLYEEAQLARRQAELAELELRAGEARLRIALDAAGLGTWDYSPMTGVLRWDVRSKALAGLGPEADVDWSVFLRAIHPDDRERVERSVAQALDPDTDMSFDLEYRLVGLGDGIERWVASRGQAIAQDGAIVRFIGAMLDVTAKKRVEEERARLLASEQQARAAAEMASRAKDEFLATVSHELRNPLNAILGWSRVLIEEGDEADSERRRRGLDVILRNAKAQVQLVEDILEVSRIVTGKLRLSTGPVALGQLLATSVDSVRAAAHAKRVALVVDAIDETIIADEDRVQQILWNLLSNAVKFTPPGGEVRVTTVRRPEAVELVVADTGEGIDPEFLPYVFDRFRQFDGSTTRTHGGLGLGLAIVRHLAELHGGTATAASAGLGCGSRFIVTLPIIAVAADPETIHRSIPPTPTPQPRSGRPLEGRRVLVLDDEIDMRDLIGMILEDAGAAVRTVGSVRAALDALAEEVPDVAVSDLAMPGEDGFAFARQVRAASEPNIAAVPLVAMTAYARAEDRRRVLAGGFDRHVAKPIEPEQLVEALAAVISRRGLEG